MTEMKLKDKIRTLLEEDSLTTAKIQRRFEVGYSFAASIMDKLIENGLVLEFDRKVKVLKKAKTDEAYDIILNAFHEKWQRELSDSGNAGVVCGNPELECVKIILPKLVKRGKASAAFFQKELMIGYPRAARMIDKFVELGVVSDFEEGYKCLIKTEDIERIVDKFK